MEKHEYSQLKIVRVMKGGFMGEGWGERDH